jgi:hypothetical protein
LNTEIKHRVSNRYNLREESLQPFMVKESRLLLEFSAREISFALIHVKTNQLLFLNNLSVVSSGNADLPDFEKLISEQQTLLENSKDIVFCWKTPEFTLVPQNLLDISQLPQLLRAGGCDPEPDEVCLYTSKSISDYHIAFSIPAKVKTTLESFSEKTMFFPSVYPLLNAALQTARINDGKIVVVNVFDEAFELVVAESRKILFCNSFPFRSPEDFVYFLLLVTENIGLSNDKESFYFCGQIEKNSAIFQLCQKYIRHLKWMDRPGGIEISNTFSSLPSHFFYSFFQLHHCV